MFKFLAFSLLVTCYLSLVASTYAVVDPLSTSNNKFGIHILTDNPKDASDAASLVNSNGGDWGYITFLIESGNRDTKRWQAFFNDLRRRHLIPIVRIATRPVSGNWEVPYEKEHEAWAEFLNSLVWPTKNRYVIIYNEPNHGQEWAGKTDPAGYAKILNETIDSLKQKSPDFFVLNAGFDASTPHQPPNYYDEEKYLREMNVAVPGIFNKLDGWSSHSYPNPGFRGSPEDSGRGSIETYKWELDLLKELGATKNLPVFITETGWKHSSGLNNDRSLPSPETVASYYKSAFENVWNDPRVIAVTPFILNYQEPPFDHFSFKRITGEKQIANVLGAQYPEHYPHYEVLAQLQKSAGVPIQENLATLVKGEIYKSLVSGENYKIPLTLKNTGQTIWEKDKVTLVPTKGAFELGLSPIKVSKDVEPGEDYTFEINFKAPQSGEFFTEYNLYNGEKEFNNGRFSFESKVRSPVVLKIQAMLPWGSNPSGIYLLDMGGVNGDSIRNVTINQSGFSDEIEARNLLPGYEFDFTLSRKSYQPKTIHVAVESGVNELNFKELEPDILSLIFNPIELLKFLPIGN